jgi:tetratricopeptide (TPR) repeat protein
VLAEVLAALDRLPDTTPPFFPPITLGYTVCGTATGAPRVYFEDTVLLGRHVGAAQAHGYVLCSLADLALLDGRSEDALTAGREALNRFAALGDRDGQAFALNRLGCLHRQRGEHRDGRKALEQSLALRRAIGDRRATGMTLANLGVLTAAEGDLATGRALLGRAMAGFGETGDVPGLVGHSLTMASVWADHGDHGAAEQQLRESLPPSQPIPGNHRATAWGYAVLADVCRRQGRGDEAAEALSEAGRLFDAFGAVDGAAHVRSVLQSRR